ncbi:MAG: ABC transporter ATP-binding protein [Acidimicrobiales bacterium]
MTEFVRTLLRTLDRATKRRLAIASVAGALLACIEALTLALIAPLVLLVNATASRQEPIPSSARWAARLVHSSDPTRVAALLGIAVLVAFVVKGVLAVLLLRWSIGVVLEAEAETSTRLFRAYLLAPWTFHLGRNSAELQRTTHDSVRRVFEDATASFVGAIGDAAILLAVTLLFLVTDPLVAIAVIGYFGLVGAGYQRLIHSRAEAAGAEVLGQVRHSYQTVQQGVRSAKQLLLLHRQERFVQELRTTKLQMASRVRTVLLLMQLPRYYLETALITGVGLMSVLLFSNREPAQALGALGFFLAAGFRLLPSLNRVLVASSSARSNLPALRAIHDDLELLETAGGPTSTTGPLPAGPIELDRVTYAYPGAPQPALRDLSLTIPPGECLGIVGGSGAGKTTFLDVLLGLLPPDGGTITVGGVPQLDVLEPFQRSVGYVPQNVGLVDDTLLANIAFACSPEEIDGSRVAEAAQLAQLDDLIARLPRGLDSMVGEEGVRLSGGERQRVGIARALYHRPSILVFDEATSALDSSTESRITATIEGLRGDRTIIVVAHRLSTVRGCDRLCLLREGRIAASGTFAHLNAASAEFREFVRLGDLRVAAEEPEAPTPECPPPAPAPRSV